MKLYATVVILLVSALKCFAGTKADLVVVDKSERKMSLLSSNRVIASYAISLGAIPKGHKRQEGDQKTPEGSYVLDYKKEDSAFYRAMHISYPNAEDIAQAQARNVSPGGLIMVHGQPDDYAWPASVDWTAGCIAISNTEMDEFMLLVDSGTPIQISW